MIASENINVYYVGIGACVCMFPYATVLLFHRYMIGLYIHRSVRTTTPNNTAYIVQTVVKGSREISDKIWNDTLGFLKDKSTKCVRVMMYAYVYSFRLPFGRLSISEFLLLRVWYSVLCSNTILDTILRRHHSRFALLLAMFQDSLRYFLKEQTTNMVSCTKCNIRQSLK